MPYWFQFSKNGRREDGTPAEKCAKPNLSTMNRICAAFEDIKRVDFNMAGIGPFNYQMLLSKDDIGYDQNVVEVFVAACQEGINGSILSSNVVDFAEKNRAMKRELVTEHIAGKVREVAELEEAYTSVVKYLFTGENEAKGAFKIDFWAVFGDIAIRKLRENIANCYVCPKCKRRIPVWAKMHNCTKAAVCMFECVGCGKILERTGSKQCRCADCQKEYRKIQVRRNVANMRARKAA